MGIRRTLIAATAAAAVTPLAAAERDGESPWHIGVAFGYGERSNPLVQSDDIPVLVDVDIAWYGRRWFFDNGDVGRTILDGQRFTLNAIARINSDRVFFGKTDTDYVSIFSIAGSLPAEPIEVPDRDYAFEAGLELLTGGDWGYAQAALQRDVSNTHDGYELYVNVGRTFRRQRWFFEPSFGATFKSDRANDYYWGVRPEESNIVLPEYQAGSGWNTHVRIASRYQLSRNWAFVVATQYERLSREAAASPLVAERAVRSGFTGFNWSF
jgi:outer membrane protein